MAYYLATRRVIETTFTATSPEGETKTHACRKQEWTVSGPFFHGPSAEKALASCLHAWGCVEAWLLDQRHIQRIHSMRPEVIQAGSLEESVRKAIANELIRENLTEPAFGKE